MLVTCHWCSQTWEVAEGKPGHDCPEKATRDAMLHPRGSEAKKFFAWWQGDKERALCTLGQAIGAYCSTFPGRLHALLVELLEPMQ